MPVFGKCRKREKMIKNYSFPYDVYERHKFVSQFIGRNDEVLDVGGELGQLKKFSQTKKIVTANIKGKTDILYNGKKLPLANNSFDKITAIDVLEHIDFKERKNFLDELLRIAKKSIILSAPLGTKEHLEMEKKMIKKLQKKKKRVNYLFEHQKNGLPTLKELKILLKGLNYRIYFSGDFRINYYLFCFHSFEFKNSNINKFLFFSKQIINIILNLVLYPLMINKKLNPYINRVYVVINL